MRNEAIGYNLMAKHVREKIDMLDAFIDLIEHMSEQPVHKREGQWKGYADYYARQLHDLRMGNGSGSLPDDLMPIAMHFVSAMAMDHMRDKPRT
tara:strand:- start:779 stop:1060 length:282 start_codon:yes stop_codon:yes gene_type:complete